MLKIKAEKRGTNSNNIPAILYGPKIKNVSLEVEPSEFNRIFKETGESTLVSIELDGKKKSVALIYDVQKNPLTDKIIHVDFYQPILTEKVEATVPLIFEGESPAVKESGGTLIREIQELEVKALPEKLPHDIRVNVEVLKTFEDEILVKDLNVSEEVTILKEQDEIVANVLPPQTEKIEEELEKPVEEDVEKVEKVGEKEEEETVEEEVKEEPKEKEEEKKE